MKNFMKDIRSLAQLKTSEKIIAHYEQGFITLDEAVLMMRGLADVVDIVSNDAVTVEMAQGLDKKGV